ncbi:unnamed protein product [Eruca vesicaria subsp. sativa]|uniref:Serine aminopeptidase S33 domain-containing protein n=1 Tax=Eruca vesicaria subsp. sativa TaxID=29727 RepID=A0ABC8L8E0_ERUVS|nr:unnamed protein product [Eruca vesicaria subsp. sativa]
MRIGNLGGSEGTRESKVVDCLLHSFWRVRENEYCYKGRPRLKTAYQLLLVSIPFIVLHGEDDKVTDKSVSKMLYEVASSSNKTVKLYPNMWHALLYGETLENAEILFSDVIKWLVDRTSESNRRLESELKHKHDELLKHA